MAKGDSGSRRWIERRPIDSRPIVSDYDIPRWQFRLEAIAPWGCAIVGGLTILLAAYAWVTDALAGHIQ